MLPYVPDRHWTHDNLCCPLVKWWDYRHEPPHLVSFLFLRSTAIFPNLLCISCGLSVKFQPQDMWMWQWRVHSVALRTNHELSHLASSVNTTWDSPLKPSPKILCCHSLLLFQWQMGIGKCGGWRSRDRDSNGKLSRKGPERGRKEINAIFSMDPVQRQNIKSGGPRSHTWQGKLWLLVALGLSCTIGCCSWLWSSNGSPGTWKTWQTSST